MLCCHIEVSATGRSLCVCVCVSWGVTKCGDNPVHIQRVGRKEMKEGRKGGRKEGGKEGRREGARDGR